jgi:Leucine-rich repeat (LRR) protein
MSADIGRFRHSLVLGLPHLVAAVVVIGGLLGDQKMSADEEKREAIVAHPPLESQKEELDRIAGKDPRRRDAIRRWKDIQPHLSGVTGSLREMTVSGPGVDDDDLRDLELFPEVTRIVVADAEVTDDTVALLGRLPNIEAVDLISCLDVTDACCAELSKLTKLKSLGLNGCQIGDNGVAQLRVFPSLAELYFGETHITSASLKYVAKHPGLIVLDLGGTSIDDDGLRHLSHSTSIRRMLLQKTNITDKGIAHLRNLTNVAELWLLDTAVGDESLQIIGTFPDMHSLDLCRTRVTSDGIASLVGLTRLRKLWLEGTDVDDRCIEDLLKLKSLEVLVLLKTKVSKQGVDRLRAGLSCSIVSDFGAVRIPTADEPKVIFVNPPEESGDEELDRIAGKDSDRRVAIRRWRSLHQYVNGRGGKLKEITLEGSNIRDEHLHGLELFPEVKSAGFVEAGATDAGVAFLGKFSNLEVLSVFRCPNVTDASCAELAKLQKLNVLDFSGTRIGDDGVARLPVFPKLARLDLSETQVTSASLEYVATLPRLKMLNLAGTQIDDDGLRHLRRMTSLSDVWLHENKITDEGFAHLRKLIGMSQLLLRDTHIGDESLRIIGTFSDMQSLDVQRTRVTNDGVVALVGLGKLRNLWLAGTVVDDGCVSDLLKMQTLKILDLTKTKVSKQGVERLRAGLKCAVYSDLDADE